VDFQSITRWLARGPDAAREEAQRVLDELLERGDMGPEEADAIRAGILEAVESNRRFLQERVGAPLRELLGALASLREGRPSERDTPREGGPSERDTPREGGPCERDALRAILERLDELSERVGRLESRLGGGGRD
jgi:polyhydroxyalkanoate synthesis regulator phasin